MTSNINTLLVQSGRVERPVNQPASLPIYASSGWEFESPSMADAIFSGLEKGAAYGNRGTPNHEALEQAISAAEGAEATAVSTSGMAAISSTLLSFLEAGDRLVAGTDLFGPTAALLDDLRRWQVAIERVDATNLGAVRRALESPAKVLYVETMSNPLLRVPDLRTLADIAHEQGTLLIVDNTFASPFHCRPIALGADLCIESATKMMAGHHDTILGAISGAERLIEVVRSFMYRLGTRPSAFDAWLVMRGLQTLAVRQERAAATAEEIAAWLAAHSAVRRVSFPGLGTHPDHRVARAQLSNGYGSTLSFEIGGGADGAEHFVRALEMITLVHSLGGVRTTLSHAATMTHRSLSPAERTSAGLHAGFFRLSVGLEDASDIAADLSRGLAEVSS